VNGQKECLTCSVENLCFGTPKGSNKIAGGGNPRKESSLFLSPEGAAHVQLFYRASLTLLVFLKWEMPNNNKGVFYEEAA